MKQIENSYIKPLKIGEFVTRHNLVLAPLAGISNYPFRELCRRFGADLTFTEMVSADGIVHSNKSTNSLLAIKENERPIGFQLFGSDPETFARALPAVEALKPDVIDINFGCPVQKVVKRGAGAALLKNISQMGRIVQVVKHSRIPVTAKVRLGWDWTNIVVKDAALAVEAAGADAVIVHGRTRSQGYSGQANWEHIAEVKNIVKIPVIGNGDVFDGPAALKMFRTTGVDGIMLARGTMGRPWLFREILQFIAAGENFSEPPVQVRIQVMEDHYRLEVAELGESKALSRMKKHFVWYTHGLPYIAKMRDQIFRASSFTEIREIFAGYLDKFGEPEMMSAGALEKSKISGIPDG